jgi:hypothetical protein
MLPYAKKGAFVCAMYDCRVGFFIKIFAFIIALLKNSSNKIALLKNSSNKPLIIDFSPCMYYYLLESFYLTN